MRRAAMVLSAVALVCATANLSAQGTPNFAGKWTLVPDPNAAAGGGGGGGGGRGGGGGGRGSLLGMEATVNQDAKVLTVTRVTQQGEDKRTYNLDGTDSKNTVQGRGGAQEQTSKAKWEGQKLVITTTFMAGENAVTTTTALSFDSAGQLIEESTGMGRGGAAPTTTKRTYKKG